MAYGEGGRSGGGGFRRGGGGGGGYGRGGGGGGFRRDFGGPREMSKITCSECGKEDEVPFKPRQGTPVYCKNCFAKRNGRSPRSEGASQQNSEDNSEEM